MALDAAMLTAVILERLSTNGAEEVEMTLLFSQNELSGAFVKSMVE
jgi:hypothetical protein